MTIAQSARVAYLVGHHHTLRGIDGIDYQILIEADYIANASENGCSRESIEIFLAKVMRTDSGRRLARAVLCGGGEVRNENLRAGNASGAAGSGGG